ncbi:MAG: tyrosine-type recombinase/integrase [Spirochaetes bacterium]|nr:tyrosine-type recombinase/integrase [Spirochaetota bacterium]
MLRWAQGIRGSQHHGRACLHGKPHPVDCRGKGNKDRVTIFSESLRPSLEEFIEIRDGNEFLFTSEYQGRKQLHVRSVQMIFKQAIVKSGINKKASCPICVTAQSLSHPKNNYQV